MLLKEEKGEIEKRGTNEDLYSLPIALHIIRNISMFTGLRATIAVISRQNAMGYAENTFRARVDKT